MPEQTDNPQDTPDPGTENTQGEPADLGDAGKKALAAERDARKAAEKTAADYKAKLDQIEQANLPELEKAQRAAQEAQDQLATATRLNTRNQVALAKGVPADLVDFLTGDTENEISAKADVLLARLNAPAAPRPDLTQGGKSARSTGSGNPEADFATFLTNQLGAPAAG